MSANSDRSTSPDRSIVEPHTQYVRARFRCRGCGEDLPADRDPAGESLCVECRAAR